MSRQAEKDAAVSKEMHRLWMHALFQCNQDEDEDGGLCV
jgi:hypothetical protein